VVPTAVAPKARRLLTATCLSVVLGAAAVTLAALWYWRAWDGGLKGPLVYEGDALLYQRLARTIAQRGWYLARNPILGAPTGQLLHDYPLGSDNLQFLLLRLFAFGTSNPFAITNLYFYLTFPLAYLACCYSLRRLGVSVMLAVPLSVIYALAPYHFLRGVSNLFLSGYYAVPLACLLLYELLARTSADVRHGEEEVSNDPPQTLRSWLRSREFWWGRWLWVPALLGSTGAYHALFFVFLALGIGVLSALGARSTRTLARSLVVAGVTIAVLALNNAPTFIYRAHHGNNDVVAKRSLGDADTFALQPAYLLLPMRGHRISLFADLRAKANQSVSPLPNSVTIALGGTAAVGMVLSIAALVASGRNRDHWKDLSRRSGKLNVLTLILGSAGGGSLLLGLFGFAQLRDYGRLVIFMAFFSLAAVAARVQPLLRRLSVPPTSVKVVIAVVLVGLATSVAILDQTASRGSRASRKQTQDRVAQDLRLATAIEQRLGKAAMVLQLPLLGFPEDAIAFPARPRPTNFALNGYEIYNGYELFRPSLFTSSLRWSYGAIQNRPDDLSPSFGSKPMQLFLQQAVSVGFDGIYIDRNSLSDDGVALLSQLEAHLGGAALKNDRAVFFDLRPYRQNVIANMPADRFSRLEIESRQPLELSWGRLFQKPDGNGRFFPQLPGLSSGRYAANGATLEVTNRTASPRALTVHATARLAMAGSAELTASHGTQAQRFTITASGQTIVLRMVVPPGTSRMTLATDRPDGVQRGLPGRTVMFRLEDVWSEG
jgi:hypothetical protein